MKRKLRLFYVLWAVMLVCPYLISQVSSEIPSRISNDYMVDIKYFGAEDGLMHRDVFSVFEDSKGFMWIGGIKGLQRFDGHEFKNWTKADRTGLIYYISSIGQDDGGWLWLWNNDKLKFVFLHADTGEILSAEERFPDQIEFFDRNKIEISFLGFPPEIAKNNQGELVFPMRDGTIIAYSTKGGFRSYELDKRFVGDIVYIDSLDNIWMRTNPFLSESSRNEFHLTLFDKEGVLLKGFLKDKVNGISSMKELDGSLFILRDSTDAKDIPWDYGVVNQEGNIVPANLPFGNRGKIRVIKDMLWHWTDDKRIDIYDPKDYHLIEQIDVNNYDPSLSEVLHDAKVDSRGIIWLFNHFGINKIELRKNRFKNYISFDDVRNKPFNNSTRGFIVTNDTIYANCERGPSIITTKSNPNKSVKISEKLWSRAMILKPNKELWIGHPHYISSFSSDGRLIKKFLSPKINDVPSISGIWSFFNDHNDRLWIGTGNKLAYSNANEDDIKLYQTESDPHGFASRRGAIQNMIPAENGKIWFCSWTGLYLFNPDTREIEERYGSDEPGDSYLPADIFYYLHKDQEGIYWLGTSDGLIRWDRGRDLSKHDFQLLTRKDGLSNDVIYSIFEDDYNRLWLSSDYGIMSFDRKTQDIITYLEDDGISHNEFNRTSQYQEKDGTIYFGGMNGITSFHPKDFITSQHEFAKVLISDFEKFDAKEGKLLNKTGDLLNTSTINFYPSDRFFRLKFTMPTFSDQLQKMYAWKIEGVDEIWHYQDRNSIQVGMLPYGKHKLRVKGQSGGGGWSPHELKIDINVIKPFYLQAWFIILGLLGLVLAIASFFKIRTKILKREIALATEQIESDKLTIEQQAEELRKLDKLKSRFFANVSHELRTPLTLMIGPIQNLIKENGHNPREKKLLDFLHRNTLHLKNLVNEILDLSKLENNKMELKEEPLEFYSYLKDHLTQFHSFGASEAVTFSAEFPEETLSYISLDKGKFEKVINNFLSNAMKFTPPGGKVTLRVEENRSNFHLMVSDTGRGIHKDDLPFIFDRFYQSQLPDAPTEGGTGIGLSLCKELSELMGGKVWAESEVGLGSIFHFTFEKKVETKERALNINTDGYQGDYNINTFEIEGTAIEIPEKVKGARILIAEDNADLREYYKIILSEYDVVGVVHGQEALDYLNSTETTPDLIISDLMMPVMDGLQFLERLKANEKYRNLPVIMLTAKNNRNIKIAALRIGIDDYLTKPFDEEELQVRIHNLLSHYRNRMEFAIAQGVAEEEIKISNEEQEWIEDFEKYIDGNLSNEQLSVNIMSREFALSSSSLLRQLKRITGLTPAKYLQEHRLNAARNILENEQVLSISELARKVGYKDATAFTRSFRKRYGKSPSDYRQ